jgi:hypothetical protein
MTPDLFSTAKVIAMTFLFLGLIFEVDLAVEYWSISSEDWTLYLWKF